MFHKWSGTPRSVDATAVYCCTSVTRNWDCFVSWEVCACLPVECTKCTRIGFRKETLTSALERHLSTSIRKKRCKKSLLFLWYSQTNCDAKWAWAKASVHYFARKQVGDTQKRGKPEMRSSCRNSLDFALIGLGPARPPVRKCPPPQIPVSQSPF